MLIIVTFLIFLFIICLCYFLFYFQFTCSEDFKLKDTELKILTEEQEHGTFSFPSSYICGTARYSRNEFDAVFRNIEAMANRMQDYRIVIFYDKSNDNTLVKLRKFKAKNPKLILMENKEPMLPFRTERLAHARNACLAKVLELNEVLHWDYFIVMDLDDVCAKPIRLPVLDYAFQNKDRWDSISFNRTDYYDLWALSYAPFYLSYQHINCLPETSKKKISKDLAQLDKEDLLPVLSAFNGFAIYKINMFKNSTYKSKTIDNEIFFTREQITDNENAYGATYGRSQGTKVEGVQSDCEHRYFHLFAHHNNGARIMITPKKIF
jgi:glycosyltransferase involved in cell wall biosynthesis